MYAVIETGGKQYRVQEGDVITIEKLNVSAGDDITFEKVLMLSDGETVQIGAPTVEAAKVFGTVVENGKGKKVIIFKYKSKKDYRKKQGHRQPYTMVKIDSLSADGTPAPKKAVAAKPAEEKAEKVDAPAAEKKPAAKKAATEKKPAEKKAAAEKKPAAKKAAKPAEAKDAE
ncbi:50S ribosomal protein L21 [Clostridiales bacterium BAD-6]|jgi:large subunit ribosomal protein L21|uniref:Large ribosomal subunit protein bL21 n=1 Tax=Sinanaerobacter chloroacetimidivorans TaxID=2818044 RepID=A0A8J7VYW7_9FIRM|nr:50S ribosomal protein L21 [Sinanaerobacter chloroacetimidivorans]